MELSLQPRDFGKETCYLPIFFYCVWKLSQPLLLMQITNKASLGYLFVGAAQRLPICSSQMIALISMS